MPAGFMPGATPAGFMPGAMPAGFMPGAMPAGFMPGAMPAGFMPGATPAGFMPGFIPGAMPAGFMAGSFIELACCFFICPTSRIQKKYGMHMTNDTGVNTGLRHTNRIRASVDAQPTTRRSFVE
jgi:hypothetical protein